MASTSAGQDKIYLEISLPLSGVCLSCCMEFVQEADNSLVSITVSICCILPGISSLTELLLRDKPTSTSVTRLYTPEA